MTCLSIQNDIYVGVLVCDGQNDIYVGVLVCDGGQIKNKTVTLLLSLLEGVDSDFIPSRILEALEVDAIVGEINYQQVFHSALSVFN